MSLNQTNRVPGEPSHGVASKANESALERIENVPEYTPGDVESLRLERKVTITDPVFGDLHEGGPDYRNVHLPRHTRVREADHVTDVVQVGWVNATFLMIKTQVGIGILSIPRAFDILGLVPGIFTLLAVTVITTWVGILRKMFGVNVADCRLSSR